jgi:hypothetical protein
MTICVSATAVISPPPGPPECGGVNSALRSFVSDGAQSKRLPVFRNEYDVIFAVSFISSCLL